MRPWSVLLPLWLTALLDADKGNTGGGAGDDKADPPPGDDADGDDGDADDTPDGDRFTKEQVEEIVKKRVDREKAKADAARKKADDDAEAQRLADAQQWKELAEQRKQRIDELESTAADVTALQEELDAYKAALQTQLKAATKGLPKPIRELLADIPEPKQLAWIAANKEMIADAGGKEGIPETPDGEKPKPKTKEERVNKYLEQAGMRPRG